jgi:hypothetical protein
MLAKQAEDRYQIPAEVAAALAPFCPPDAALAAPERVEPAVRKERSA